MLARAFDPRFKGDVKKKKKKKKKGGVELREERVRLLADYQGRLAADDRWGVLVRAAGLDATGKNGPIRHVMSGSTRRGRGCTASSALGRGARPRLPARKGDLWKQRYGNQRLGALPQRERLPIVKLFVNLSKEEQRARLPRRIDLPDYNWKFSEANMRGRGRWDDYRRTFSEMLTQRPPNGRRGT